MTVSQLAGRRQLGKNGSWERLAVGEEWQLGKNRSWVEQHPAVVGEEWQLMITRSWGRSSAGDEQQEREGVFRKLLLQS